MDEKLAPHDFVADFVWAGRAVFRRPGVALMSIATWTLPTILFNAAVRNKNPVEGVIAMVSACSLSDGSERNGIFFGSERRA